MTTEDKNWLYIGGGLMLAGGAIYWYKNKNTGEQKSTTEPINDDDKIIDRPSTATPTYMPEKGRVYNDAPPTTRATKATTIAPAAPAINAATFMYALGQKIFCKINSACVVYDVQKDANGSFFSKNLEVGRFGKGEAIGTIKGITKEKSGRIWYDVETSKRFSKSSDSNFCRVNHARVSGIYPVLKTTSTANIPTINTNKILKLGSKGNEVKVLQKKLNFVAKDIDGDFGAKTETALFTAKKVKQIALSGF